MTPINFIAAAPDYLNFRSVLPLLVSSYSWWPVLKSNKDKIFSIHASKPFIHPCTDVRVLNVQFSHLSSEVKSTWSLKSFWATFGLQVLLTLG